MSVSAVPMTTVTVALAPLALAETLYVASFRRSASISWAVPVAKSLRFSKPVTVEEAVKSLSLVPVTNDSVSVPAPPSRVTVFVP